MVHTSTTKWVVRILKYFLTSCYCPDTFTYPTLPLLWLLWPQEVLDWHYDGHRLCHPAVQPLGRLWSLLLMPWHSHQWVGLVINLLLEVDNGDKRKRQQTQQLLSYKIKQFMGSWDTFIWYHNGQLRYIRSTFY